MSGSRSELVEVASTDERYAFEAYEFLCHALAFTQEQAGRPAVPNSEHGEAGVHHVTGQELLEGIRQFGIEQFGMMTPVVFRTWGVHATDDFGAMVYRLIDAGLWHKSPTDRLEDFEGLYDFDKVFVDDFRIEWEED